MHYGSYSTAFRATLISYGNKKNLPLDYEMEGKKLTARNSPGQA